MATQPGHSRRPSDANTHETPTSPLLTIKQAARLLGISESKAFELAREGNLPGLVKLPGHRQIVRRAVLEAWLAGADVPEGRPALRRVS